MRDLESGGPLPREVGTNAEARLPYIALLKRLLRQWAIPPARQFNRLPSRARVVMCAGLPGVWQYSRGMNGGAQGTAAPPPMTQCQVVNHTTGGYALRQVDSAPASLRVGDLIALRVEGRPGLQVAMVRWFRNTLNDAMLEFGCELLSENPEAAAAAPENAADGDMLPVRRAAGRRRCGSHRARTAACGTRRRVHARAGGEPAPGQRDRLRRAHEARRAGTGIRPLRIRAR